MDPKEYLKSAPPEALRAVIGKVNNQNYRDVLACRYIDHMKWEAIATAMRYETRYVYKLHRRALKVVGERLKKGAV